MSEAPALVADVGGTNTRVALAAGEVVLARSIRRYRNADYGDLGEVLRAYRAEEGVERLAGACVAVAGPVRDGRATLTNLDWTIDKPLLQAAAETETVSVLNDLQAQGHAIGHVPSDLLRPVLPGVPGGPQAAKLVIGIGTGFNAAPVYDTETGRYVPAAEAGHASLPVRSDEEVRLARFLEAAHGFASVEDLLSGRGVERAYAFASREQGAPREATAAEVLAALVAGDDSAAEAAARLFVTLLGSVAGNLSLLYLPFGGVFLVGGVSRAFAPHLARFGFAEAFRDKGRFSSFMDTFPVTVIEDDYAALSGCAAHLAHLLGEPSGAA